MQEKQYLVVFLPTNETITGMPETKWFADYDEAFQCLSDYAFGHVEKNVSKPKREKPLRIKVGYDIVELWIATRPTDTLTE